MPETTPTSSAPTLADLCGDLLAFALQLKRSKDPGDAEAFLRRTSSRPSMRSAPSSTR